MKIAIAIPENRDVILKGMFWGFLRFLSSIEQPVILLGNNDDQLVPGKTSYIDNMRNRLVERAQELECTHIFFIDSDTIPPVNALKKLVDADKDIIGGVYRFRVPPYKTLAFWYAANRYIPMDELPPDKIFAVDGIGMGCTLIKMEVFDKLEKPYYFSGYVDFDSPYLPKVLPKKDNDIVKKRYLGEDIYFCEKAVNAGFEIFLNTGVQCDHITQVCIPGNLKTPVECFHSDHRTENLIYFGEE